MTARDERIRYLVAVLTVLGDGLGPVVDDLLAGDVPQTDLNDLAGRFETVARMLRSVGFDQPSWGSALEIPGSGRE